MKTKSNLPAKRGRVKGQTATLSVIKDPILEPFIIKIEENQFVLTKVTDTKEEVYGYYSKLSNCLLKVAEIKTPTEPVFTLREFVNKYDSVAKQMLATVKI